MPEHSLFMLMQNRHHASLCFIVLNHTMVCYNSPEALPTPYRVLYKQTVLISIAMIVISSLGTSTIVLGIMQVHTKFDSHIIIITLGMLLAMILCYTHAVQLFNSAKILD